MPVRLERSESRTSQPHKPRSSFNPSRNVSTRHQREQPRMISADRASILFVAMYFAGFVSASCFFVDFFFINYLILPSLRTATSSSRYCISHRQSLAFLCWCAPVARPVTYTLACWVWWCDIELNSPNGLVHEEKSVISGVHTAYIVTMSKPVELNVIGTYKHI